MTHVDSISHAGRLAKPEAGRATPQMGRPAGGPTPEPLTSRQPTGDPCSNFELRYARNHEVAFTLNQHRARPFDPSSH